MYPALEQKSQICSTSIRKWNTMAYNPATLVEVQVFSHAKWRIGRRLPPFL